VFDDVRHPDEVEGAVRSGNGGVGVRQSSVQAACPAKFDVVLRVVDPHRARAEVGQTVTPRTSDVENGGAIEGPTPESEGQPSRQGREPLVDDVLGPVGPKGTAAADEHSDVVEVAHESIVLPQMNGLAAPQRRSLFASMSNHIANNMNCEPEISSSAMSTTVPTLT